MILVSCWSSHKIPTQTLQRHVKHGSTAYNHLLWFMSHRCLFSIFSSVFLSLDDSRAQWVLSASSLLKVPNFTKLPGSQLLLKITCLLLKVRTQPGAALLLCLWLCHRSRSWVLFCWRTISFCLVFFPLWCFSIFSQISLSWPCLTGYCFINIKLWNEFSTVIIRTSCSKYCNGRDTQGKLGDSQKTGGVYLTIKQ